MFDIFNMKKFIIENKDITDKNLYKSILINK